MHTDGNKIKMRRPHKEAKERAPPFGPRVTETASASLSMPAASPRRQASPVDMTLKSARTTRRRRAALAGLGCSCRDEDEKAAAAAEEAAVRYIEAAAVGTRIEGTLRRPGAEQRQPAGEYDPTGRRAEWAPGSGRCRPGREDPSAGCSGGGGERWRGEPPRNPRAREEGQGERGGVLNPHQRQNRPGF